MDRDVIAKNLRDHRKRKGLTQELLSENSGVAVRTIQRIERAQVAPHLQTLSLLASALELEVHELSVGAPSDKLHGAAVADLKWLAILHLSPVVGFILPFSNLVIPLILWVYKREEHPLYDRHGRAVVNFHITVTVVFMLAVALLVLLFPLGLLLLVLTAVYTLILILWNTRRVLKRQSCTYPLAAKLL
ncbi:MAG: helix-turn-helix domain-containing protein [Hymenobacteraceae bacterium]|nr:helix-turn-helix domain-containing protein [Hymenobacteraceae bacterium]